MSGRTLPDLQYAERSPALTLLAMQRLLSLGLSMVDPGNPVSQPPQPVWSARSHQVMVAMIPTAAGPTIAMPPGPTGSTATPPARRGSPAPPREPGPPAQDGEDLRGGHHGDRPAKGCDVAVTDAGEERGHTLQGDRQERGAKPIVASAWVAAEADQPGRPISPPIPRLSRRIHPEIAVPHTR